MDAKQKYEQQLAELDEKIDEVKEERDTVIPSYPGAPKIDYFEAGAEKKKLLEQMEGLIKKRDETQLQLDLINAYIDKATKKGKYGRREIYKHFDNDQGPTWID